MTLYEFMKSLMLPDIGAILLSWLLGLTCVVGVVLALLKLREKRLVMSAMIVLMLVMGITSITAPIARIYFSESQAQKILDHEAEDKGLRDESAERARERKQDRELFDRTTIAMLNRAIPSVVALVENVAHIVVVILVLIVAFVGRREPKAGN